MSGIQIPFETEPFSNLVLFPFEHRCSDVRRVVYFLLLSYEHFSRFKFQNKCSLWLLILQGFGHHLPNDIRANSSHLIQVQTCLSNNCSNKVNGILRHSLGRGVFFFFFAAFYCSCLKFDALFVLLFWNYCCLHSRHKREAIRAVIAWVYSLKLSAIWIIALPWYLILQVFLNNFFSF